MRAAFLALLLLLPGLAAAGEPARGDLIVTFRDPSDAPAGLLSILPALVVPDAAEADAARWSRDARVERVDWAKPLERHGASALPSAAFFGLTRADRAEGTGAGITVAVVDSGIDATHPDLAGRVVANARLVQGRFVDAPGDTDGHGTHVAGIVGASGASSEGRWPGVAPDARLVGVDISGRFTTASAILAYEWLAEHREEHDIRVVVNAWGRVPDGDGFDPRDPELRAIESLVAEGVVVLFSASNRGPGASTLSIEAMSPHVITVGATDAAGLVMDYSSRGPVHASEPWVKPDLVAPGDAVVSLRSAQALPDAEDPDLLHASYSGTSQAVPHVAGIVARMLEVEPSLTPQQVADALRASAIDLGEPGPDDASGYGLVDARDALLAAQGRAPDRGNVLVAGGRDRYQDTLALPAAPRRGLFDLLEAPQVVWDAPFPVKPGATRVRVDASAAGAQPFELELLKDGRVVRGTEVERPEAGIWTLRLRSAVPVATEARMLVEAEMPPRPARALEFDAKPAPAPRPLPNDSWTLAREHTVLAGCILVGALAGAALMPRRSRDK